jgi:hypothetical protein
MHLEALRSGLQLIRRPEDTAIVRLPDGRTRQIVDVVEDSDDNWLLVTDREAPPLSAGTLLSWLPKSGHRIFVDDAEDFFHLKHIVLADNNRIILEAGLPLREKP